MATTEVVWQAVELQLHGVVGEARGSSGHPAPGSPEVLTMAHLVDPGHVGRWVGTHEGKEDDPEPPGP